MTNANPFAETIARLSPQPSKASSTRPFDGA